MPITFNSQEANSVKEQVSGTQGSVDNVPEVDLSNEGLHGNGGQQYTNQQFVNQQPMYSKPLSLLSTPDGFMRTARGSEYTNNVAKILLDAYSNNQLRPKVHVFDREQFTNLAYSAIVVSLLRNTTVTYFIILLEATGRNPLTVANMANVLANLQRFGGTNLLDIHTADDAVNELLLKLVDENLAKEYPGSTELRCVDGLVLGKNHDTLDGSGLGQNIAVIAFNACLMEAELGVSKKDDLSIATHIRTVTGERFSYNKPATGKHRKDPIGKPIRADWSLDLVVTNVLQNQRILNANPSTQVVTSTTGYVDAIPVPYTLTNPTNNQPMTVTRFIPNIVVTHMSTCAPTTGYMLLALSAAATMANRDMWIGAVSTTDKFNSVGNLNVLAEIGNSSGVIDLLDKNITTEQIYEYVNNLFPLDPIISVDVESYGASSSYTSVLAIASMDNGQDSMAAREHIIQTAVRLTDGVFPVTFDRNKIFASAGITLPMGYYLDKTGMECDIRDFDMAYICGNPTTGDVLSEWASTNAPHVLTNKDPYITKVNILNRIKPDAVVTGKATRVVFTTEFITTLSAALRQVNFTPVYDSNVQLSTNSNISMLANLYGGAGIKSGTGFAQPNISNAGTNFFVPYANGGVRFGH